MFQRQPSYPSTYGLRMLNQTLKKAVEDAEKAVGTASLEPHLERISKIFDNYMILLNAIGVTNRVLAVATRQFNESDPGSERQQLNQQTMLGEQKKLADHESKLRSMEDKLCEYVDNYKKASNSGDEKQALLNRAPITLWNVLCQSNNLCIPPDYKVHGAEAIYARHALVGDKKQEAVSEAKGKPKDHEKEKQRELAKRLSEDAERQEREAAEAKNRQPGQPPGGPALPQSNPPGGPALESEAGPKSPRGSRKS